MDGTVRADIGEEIIIRLEIASEKTSVQIPPTFEMSKHVNLRTVVLLIYLIMVA
jgi:hypothetical protein